MENVEKSPATGPGKDHKPGIQIFINDQPFKAPKDVMTGAELKSLGNIPSGNKLYKEIPGSHEDQSIADTQQVELKPGDKFYDLPSGVVGSPEILPSVRVQLEFAQSKCPGLTWKEMGDGTIRVHVPSISIPSETFNLGSTDLVIILPQGFPTSKPNGFEANGSLRLKNGQNPNGAGPNSIEGAQYMHFCWQPQTWDQNRETVWRYIKFVEKRFWEVRA